MAALHFVKVIQYLVNARREFLLIDKFRSDNKGQHGGTVMSAVVSTGFLCGFLSPLVYMGSLPPSKGSSKVS